MNHNTAHCIAVLWIVRCRISPLLVRAMTVKGPIHSSGIFVPKKEYAAIATNKDEAFVAAAREDAFTALPTAANSCFTRRILLDKPWVEVPTTQSLTPYIFSTCARKIGHVDIALDLRIWTRVSSYTSSLLDNMTLLIEVVPVALLELVRCVLPYEAPLALRFFIQERSLVVLVRGLSSKIFCPVDLFQALLSLSRHGSR